MFVGEKVSQMGKASILVRYKCMHRRSCRPLSPWHYIILLSISTTQRRKGTLLPALALFFSHDHTHHLTLPNVICGNPLPSKGRESLEQAANVGEPWRHRVHNILGVRERCKLTVIESKCKGENRRAFSFYGSTLPPGGGHEATTCCCLDSLLRPLSGPNAYECRSLFSTASPRIFPWLVLSSPADSFFHSRQVVCCCHL